MGRKARKPASRKAGPGDPRNSSTGVQKPPRTAIALAIAPSEDSLPAPPISLAPMFVNMDWLTLNMEAPEDVPRTLPWCHLDPVRWVHEHFAERVYFTRPTTRRTNHFNAVCEVVDEMERKVLTVWHDPHSNGMHRPNWLQVQFANETLYTGEWFTLLNMLELLGCTVSSVSKLDISCDGIEGEGGDFLKVVDATRNGNARFYGACDWVVRGARGSTTGAELGHRSSNKFVRCYRKKREMKARGVKQHIVKKWEQALGYNPMHMRAEVVRFEGSFKGKEVRRYFPDEKLNPRAFVHGLTDHANLVDMVASMAVGMLDVRTVPRKQDGTEGRAREARPVCVWDWSKVVDVPPSLAFRATRNVAVSDHTIKTELRALFRMGVVTKQTALLDYAMAQAVAAGAHWVEWYERKRIEWTKDYGKAIASGDLRTLEFFNRLMDPPPGPALMTREEWDSVERVEQFNAWMEDRYEPEHPRMNDELPPDVDPW